jgi:putative FmdB family regulatory protein
MPIFEYVCNQCECQFEKLLLKPEDGPPECPGCGGKKVKKIMSAAAVRPQGIPKGSGGFKPPACAASDD